jgi:DNA modification methylase
MQAQEEPIPEAPAEPVTRAGDTWLVGKHRLICGDCRDRDVVHRLLEGAKANLVITSPPYATQRGIIMANRGTVRQASAKRAIAETATWFTACSRARRRIW